MTDTVVIAEERAENTGHRFSWGLAIAGGVVATAVTFFLLSLGSGFGLLLVNPVTHAGPSMPTFLTGGAIYFLVAQAFGFAVGGHITGRLIGPLAESKKQEEFRAEAHGFVVWAVAVLATLIVVAIVGLSAANTGASTAGLYGMSGAKAEITPSSYLVDVLFRPESTSRPVTGVVSAAGPANPEVGASSSNFATNTGARAEAGRIVDAGFGLGMQPNAGDRSRLIDLVSSNVGVSQNEAAHRVDAMHADLKARAERAANIARKAASFTALWIALSLLFGAIVSITAAIAAREEDDLESIV
jgi:hypothetical protein